MAFGTVWLQVERHGHWIGNCCRIVKKGKYLKDNTGPEGKCESLLIE